MVPRALATDEKDKDDPPEHVTWEATSITTTPALITGTASYNTATAACNALVARISLKLLAALLCGLERGLPTKRY